MGGLVTGQAEEYVSMWWWWGIFCKGSQNYCYASQFLNGLVLLTSFLHSYLHVSYLCLEFLKNTFPSWREFKNHGLGRAWWATVMGRKEWDRLKARLTSLWNSSFLFCLFPLWCFYLSLLAKVTFFCPSMKWKSRHIEKLTSKEECLSSQKVEIDLLKVSKEELNNSLKATTEILEELKKTKGIHLSLLHNLESLIHVTVVWAVWN